MATVKDVAGVIQELTPLVRIDEPAWHVTARLVCALLQEGEHFLGRKLRPDEFAGSLAAIHPNGT